MIHILNADLWADVLRECEPIRGEVFVWREMYDFGPFAPGWDEAEQAKIRAAFFEKRLGIPAGQMNMVLTYQEQRLNRLPRSSRLILWFDTDRYDQLMLLYLLRRIRALGIAAPELVTIPRGLTPDTASEPVLERLFQQRTPLGEGHLEEAAAAWEDYISPDPRGIVGRAYGESGFSHLPAAFRTHLEHFPSRANGLNAVEELSLTLIRRGVTTVRELFHEVTAARPEDGLSDVHFAAILHELASAAQPLLRSETAVPAGETPDEGDALSLTALGKRVLDGEEDRIRTAGIDCWVGGVHLNRDRWRRDGKGCLVDTS